MKFKLFFHIILLLLTLVVLNSCSIFSKQQKITTDKDTKAEKDNLEFTYSFLEGNKQKMLGNYSEAAAYYLKCLQINKKSSSTMYELANIYVLIGDFSSALVFAEECVKNTPDNIWYNLLLATLYERQNMSEKAVVIFRDLVSDNPSRMDFKLELASLLVSTNKPKEALKIYDEIESNYGVIGDINMEKEKLYLKMGETEKAYAELYKLIDKFPTEARYYGLLAEIYVSKDEFDKALDIYNRLLKVDPDNGLAHLSLSEYYRITNEPDKSFDELKIAFASSDVDIDMKIKMVLAFHSYSGTEKVTSEKTYELLEILEETHKQEPKALTIYADFLSKDEKWEEAREKYRTVLETTKKNYLIWEQLMFINNQLNDFKALYTESKEALEYFPNQPNLYLFNGIGATKQRKYTEAVESLKTGLGLIADNKALEVQFYIYLAEAYFKNNNYDESDSYFEKALKIEPENKYILNNFSYYLSIRSEKLDDALRMTKKCNELEINNSTYLDTYAWVLYKMGKYDSALEIIEKSIINGGGGSAVIIEHKGDILFQLGKNKEAIELWKKAKELGRGSEFLDRKIEEGTLIE